MKKFHSVVAFPQEAFLEDNNSLVGVEAWTADFHHTLGQQGACLENDPRVEEDPMAEVAYVALWAHCALSSVERGN
jgi:hypothetical protein